jgi:thiol-disulfide isomerase/thioredoxin
MNFIVIGENQNNPQQDIDMLNHQVDDGKHIFLFTYMDGCGPCKQTTPKWDSMKDKIKNKNDVVVVRLNSKLFPLLKKMGSEPAGYPSIRYVTSKGVEEYEDCTGSGVKDRSTESFLRWIQHKTGASSSHKRSPHSKRTRRHKRARSQRGGKWTLKYKKSINCKKPKGFSQRQHCKYGRRRWKK